eukprot:gene5997-9995_t
MSLSDKSTSPVSTKKKNSKSVVLDNDSPYVPSSNFDEIPNSPETPLENKKSFDVLIEKKKKIQEETGDYSDSDMLPSPGDISEKLSKTKKKCNGCIVFSILLAALLSAFCVLSFLGALAVVFRIFFDLFSFEICKILKNQKNQVQSSIRHLYSVYKVTIDRFYKVCLFIHFKLSLNSPPISLAKYPFIEEQKMMKRLLTKNKLLFKRNYAKTAHDIHQQAVNHFMRENFESAVELYQEAIDKGSVVSINNLAVMYSEGIGIPKNEKKAIELYKKGISMDDPHSMYNLARIFMMKGNIEEAYELLSISPKLGEEYAHSISTLAYIEIYYKNNTERGVELYNLAISYGHKASNGHLGDLYLNGKLEKNEKKARDLFILASEGEDDKRSMTTLATFYLTGVGGEKNFKKAIELFEKAVSLNHTVAMNQLGLIYISGGKQDPNDKSDYLMTPDPKKAFDLFSKSANLGDPQGMLNLAWIYLNGMGVEKNPELGMKYLMDASKNGSVEAKEVLDELNSIQK